MPPAAPAVPLVAEGRAIEGAALLAALGGAANVTAVAVVAGRLEVALVDATRLDRPALAQLVERGVAYLPSGRVQLLLAAAAAPTARVLGLAGVAAG